MAGIFLDIDNVTYQALLLVLRDDFIGKGLFDLARECQDMATIQYTKDYKNELLRSFGDVLKCTDDSNRKLAEAIAVKIYRKCFIL